MEINVGARQWMGDISLEVSGNMQGIFELAQENGLSITDDLTVSETLLSNIDGLVPIDKSVLKNYLQNDIHPATGLTSADIAAQNGGIGYMGIQIDFKVS